MDTVKVILFISRESAVYDFTRHEVEVACANLKPDVRVELEVVDIAERPETAEEYNIEALPTLIVGNKRYVGAPTPETLKTCFGALLANEQD